MDKKQLQNSILEKKYDQKKWSEVLRLYFGVKQLFEYPREVSIPSTDLSTGAFELGSFYTADERLVGIYEVKLTPKAWIEKNRVSLRNLLRSVYKYDVDAALIVFTQDDKWRFSYVSEIKTEEGKKITEPKRYTYLFGNGEICRTAAERFDKLKGKHIYLNDLYDAFSVDKLNKDFFKAYKEYFERFSEHLAGQGKYRKIFLSSSSTLEKGWKDRNAKPIRDFTKKLLGRLVFLQFLQKKGWMGVPIKSKKWIGGDIRFLQGLFVHSKNRAAFHSHELRTLFFKTLNTKRKDDIAPTLLGRDIKIPYLNGGLFESDISFHQDIDFPETLFAELLDFFEQYNFTIDENDPYDSEVGIDPEMLGHIFENLLEENREKGVFYTPKEIVHYMCQESLIEYLCTQFPDYSRSDFSALVRHNRVSETFEHFKTAQLISDKLKAVKICDPAIGSGAFPMGLLKEIFECRRLLYGYSKNSEKFDPAQVKKDIIQQNIYGVDLENGAVDIARLRFWLALVVDEAEPQPLPNLDYKIMQGNSLLERFENVDLSNVASNNLKQFEPQTDLFGNIRENQLAITFTKTEITSEIQKRMKLFFNLENPELKEKYRHEINELVHRHIEYNFEFRKNQIRKWIDDIESSPTKTDKQKKKLAEYTQQLKELKKSSDKLKTLETSSDKPFFLWKLFFSDVFEEDGFDIVIGNPPYIQLQKMSEDIDILAQAAYDTFSRNSDIYCLFYEQGVKLLKPHGTLCYITSNTWMRTKFGELLRDYFAQHTNPKELLNFEDTKIFQTATVETNIILVKKEPFDKELKAAVVKADYSLGASISDYFRNNSILLDEMPKDGLIILAKQDYEIKKQIELKGKPLKDWDVEFYRGMLTGFNDAFYIDGKKRAELIKEDPKSEKIIKRLIRGREIRRWAYDFNDNYAIYPHNGLKENKKKGIPPLPRIDVPRDFPAIYKHLLQYKDKSSPLAKKNNDGTYQTLIDRTDQGDHWTNIRDCAYLLSLEEEKLVWLAITDRPAFAYDDKKTYVSNPSYFMSGKNLKYLLAFLNSKVIEWYMDKISSSTGQGTNQWNKMYIEQLPIPDIKEKNQQVMFETIVNYLLYLNDNEKPAINPYISNASAVSIFEDVLNMMVYECYFEEHMKQEEIDVLRFVNEANIPPLTKDDKENADRVGKVYKWLQEQENPIRNRIILSNIRSKDIIRRINSTTH